MINLTNYTDHPTRPGYVVFKFVDEDRANYFQELLSKDKIGFESSVSDRDRIIYLFGIKKADYKRALNANYLVSAKYRKFTIPNHFLGWTIFFITVAFLCLAIAGAISSNI